MSLLRLQTELTASCGVICGYISYIGPSPTSKSHLLMQTGERAGIDRGKEEEVEKKKESVHPQVVATEQQQQQPILGGNLVTWTEKTSVTVQR